MAADEEVRSWRGILTAQEPEADDSARERTDEDDEREPSNAGLADHEPQTVDLEEDTQEEVVDTDFSVNDGWSTHMRI